MKQNISSLTVSALLAAGLLVLPACKKEATPPAAPAANNSAAQDAADAAADAADDAADAVDDAAENLPPVTDEPAP